MSSSAWPPRRRPLPEPSTRPAHSLDSSPAAKAQRERMRVDWRIRIAERVMGYEFEDKTLGMEALMMAAGYGGAPAPVEYHGSRYLVEKNTRLAVVGDRMIGALVSARWYRTGLCKDMETALRLDLTSNPALDKRGKQLQLAQCIVVNAGHQGRVSEISVAMMATTVEALMGAVWEDRGGMDGKADALMEVEKVMEKMGFFEHHVFSPVSTSSASSLSAMVTPSSLFGSLTTGKSEGAKVVGVEKAGKRENARKMENAGNKEDAGKQEIAGRKEDVGNQDDAGNQGKMQKEEEGITLAMFTPSYVWGPLRP